MIDGVILSFSPSPGSFGGTKNILFRATKNLGEAPTAATSRSHSVNPKIKNLTFLVVYLRRASSRHEAIHEMAVKCHFDVANHT